MEAEAGAYINAMESHLVACVQQSLGLYLFENAIFLCERLVAEFHSEANIYLLATCYHRANQTFRAYHLLKDLPGPQSRYLFALCCIQMGRLDEAESALMPRNDISKVPNGAAGYFQLGRIYQLSNRHNAAIAFYNTALQLDPMMWAAYEELCALGADAEAQHYVSSTSLASTQPSDLGQGMTTASNNAFTQGINRETPAALAATPLVGQAPAESMGNLFPHASPATGMFVTPSPAAAASGPPVIIPRGNNAAGWQPQQELGATGGPMTGGVLGAGTSLPDRRARGAGRTRKVSNRLFAEPASVLRQAQLASSGPGGSPADSEALMELGFVPGVPRGERSPEGQAAAVALLQLLGEGYRLLCMYKCQEALDAFSQLPAQHYQTGWVLFQVGRAYFEMVNYREAEEKFLWARRIDPTRLKGLEYYSTVLWHMKKEVELSDLAKSAVDKDRQSPYAWCVMGNCFSLQKEHEAALRYFQRALQLDPTMAYAHTLCGHEYFANEDFEKGILCYRNAMKLDPRHYNAWFGIGHIYYRQEKYSMAEHHFRKALVINDRSSVLRCYLGMALHKLRRDGEALDALQTAINSDPHNPLARYEKASVLLAEERYKEALAELQQLREFAPREASVLFHMGKIYKKIGWTQEAHACFNAALDLQPPSADTNLIKSAIDRLGVADGEEEDEI